MLERLKLLFTKKVVFTEEQEEAYYELKKQGLEKLLGPMHEMVYHALIPFQIGGGLDLYPFTQCVPGTVFASMELIGPDGKGPKPNRIGTYEVMACTRHPMPVKGTESKEFEAIKGRIYGIMTTMGFYSQQAVLQPNETAEIPGDNNNPSCCMIFDNFNPHGQAFCIGEKTHGLLLCMEVHRSEMEYARQNGGANLIEKLKTAGVYPYSDMDRPPVV
jgi:hypothetical protein